MTADILAALNAERYGANQWWTRKPPEKPAEDQMACRRRLAECVREAETTEQKARTA